MKSTHHVSHLHQDQDCFLNCIWRILGSCFPAQHCEGYGDAYCFSSEFVYCYVVMEEVVKNFHPKLLHPREGCLINFHFSLWSNQSIGWVQKCIQEKSMASVTQRSLALLEYSKRAFNSRLCECETLWQNEDGFRK